MAIRQTLSTRLNEFGNFEVRDEEGQHAFTANAQFVDDVFIREVAFADKVIEVTYHDGSRAIYQRGDVDNVILVDLVNGQRYQRVVKVVNDTYRSSYAVALDGLGRGYIVR